jgi:predicted membrane protein
VIEVGVNSLIGDVEVVVPEGVEAELTGFSLLGDRSVVLAPVPPVPGTPRIRVRVFSVIGDVKLHSAG